MRRVTRAFVVVAALAASGCVLPGPGLTPYGRMATMNPKVGTGIEGELLAASDTVWLRSGSVLVGRAASDLLQVNVRRHTFGARRTYAWLAIGGAVTGAGLMLSCASYESSDGGGDSGGCVGLIPFFSALFIVAGSVFALTNYMSATRTYAPGDSLLPSFARFPQGLPDTVRKLQYIPAPVPVRTP